MTRQTFRKINSDWQTITIHSLADHLEGRADSELSVDVYRNKSGDYDVLTRDDCSIDYTRYITTFCKQRTAKSYARDFADYLDGTAPRPVAFADKYHDLEC